MGNDFTINFSLLPPDLQVKLWVLALDANTSKVNLAYRNGMFTSALSYSYGGNVEASLGIRRVNTSIGFNPSTGDVDLGVVYKGFDFGATANIRQKTTGLSLNFGAKPFPFPTGTTGTPVTNESRAAPV